jgi:hypothetical protein
VGAVLFRGKRVFRLPGGIPTVWIKQEDMGDMMYAPRMGRFSMAAEGLIFSIYNDWGSRMELIRSQLEADW